MIPRLMRIADTKPDAPFVLNEEQTWSFGAVADVLLRGAAWCADIGIQPGDRVVLAMSNRPLYLFAWFALAARGAIVVPVSHELFGDSLRYIVGQSESRVLLCEQTEQARFIDELQALDVSVEAFSSENDMVARVGSYERAPVAGIADDTSVAILYTSGTTGQPKGVVIPNRSYLAAGEVVSGSIGMTADDRILTFLPLHHANPQMYSVMSALTVGCSIALVKKFSASRFLQQVRHFNATGFTYVGTVLNILTKELVEPVQSSLRWCVGGGAPRLVWERLEKVLPVRVHELYGMTETGGLVTINSNRSYRFGSVGAARYDFDVAVLGDNDARLPAGTIGEIAVRPREPFVMTSGYFRKPDETLAAQRNLWFHTGDLGRFDSDGFLYFEGRKKELIRRGGEMISPVEIELTALKFAHLTDCAAVGVPDEILEEEVKLVAVPKDGFDAQALLAFMRETLPRHMVPRYLDLVDAIPKTPTQKVQRFRLVANSPATIDLKTLFD
jgi:acyl-CoA synthetase (AMP-forming)/AMP-acid ligase II